MHFCPKCRTFARRNLTLIQNNLTMKQNLLQSFRLRLALIVALLCSLGTGTAWADTIELTYLDFTNTSYNTSENTFTSTVSFGYINAMRNGNNGTPSGWAKEQVIQTKNTSSIYNKAAITGLTNIRVYTVANTNSFTITTGTSAQPTTNSVTRPSTPTGSESITYTKYENKKTTPGQTTTANYYDFAVASGNNYFKIAPGGSLYIWKIVLTYSTAAPTTCATPTFSPAAGEVPYNSEIALSCETDGATIYYTTNGDTPDNTSTEYDPEDKPKVTGDVTIKAIAIDGTGDLSDSEVASADYSVATPATPTFSPAAGSVAYGSALTLTSDTGTTIYYTTNGDTPDKTKTLYNPASKPTITAAGTIKAIAYDAGDNASIVGSADYTLKAPDAPTFSLEAGMVTKGATLTLSAEEGTTIRYTTDGSTVPTASVGTVYSSAITINAAQTIKAVAYDGAGTCSSVVTKAYTVFVGDIVTFDATSDTGDSPLSKGGVSFSCSNGALNNGSEYRLYKSSTTTISVTSGKIKKIDFTGVSGNPASGFASQSGWTTDGDNGTWTGSATSVNFTASGAQVRATEINVYVAKTAAPTFSPGSDTYSSAQSVTISTTTDGAAIYYTTNGDTPTSSSTAYSSAISVTETQTIKAIAIYDGVESSVSSATYTMNRPAAPTFDKAAGVFDAAFTLHLATETDGAAIYYTTDGTTPSNASTLYSTGVSIPAGDDITIKAIAVKNGLTSDVSSATYTYDSRTTPSFSLSETEVDLKVNEVGEISLTTNHDGTITAVSSDDTHFDVSYNSTTKKYEFYADQAGEYTITFSATSSLTYKDAEAVATVNVTKKTTSITTTPLFTSKDLHVTTSGSFTGVAKYNDSAIVGAVVSYSSSDETVATINSSTGAVTYKKAGTTTLTASYAGTDEYAASEATYVLDLIDTTPQDVEVEIALNSTTLGSTTPNGKTATVKNVSVTTNKGSSANDLVANTAHVRMYKYSNMVIVAPMGYVIKNITFTEPSSDKTWNDSPTASTGTYSSKSWTGSANSVTFTFDAGQCRIASITVTLAETVTVGSAGYTTYVTKHDVSFEGVTAYIAKKVNAETITLDAIEEAPEGTPVVIRAAAGTYALEAIDTNPTVAGNLLQASDGSVKGDEDGTIYALGVGKTGENKDKIGFYLVDYNVVVPAGKAYMVIPAGVGVKGFTFDFDGVATGINTVQGSGFKVQDSKIYNLAGQRVDGSRFKVNGSGLKTGIYIVNGKKVLVK